jgi:hypothetical protein
MATRPDRPDAEREDFTRATRPHGVTILSATAFSLARERYMAAETFHCGS